MLLRAGTKPAQLMLLFLFLKSSTSTPELGSTFAVGQAAPRLLPGTGTGTGTGRQQSPTPARVRVLWCELMERLAGLSVHVRKGDRLL